MFRFSFLLLCIALCVGVYAPANASTTQKIRFAQTGIVVVWDETGDMKRGSEVQIGGDALASPTAYVGTGILEPIKTSFAESNQITLKVASNAPIRVYANTSARLSNVNTEVVALGSNAAFSGLQTTLTNEVLAGNSIEIFRTDRKTARSAGSAESQAITLRISWAGEAAPAIVISALEQ